MKPKNELLATKLAELLGLKVITKGDQKGRYNTSYGTKTLEGLGATINRILRDLEDEHNENQH